MKVTNKWRKLGYRLTYRAAALVKNKNMCQTWIKQMKRSEWYVFDMNKEKRCDEIDSNHAKFTPTMTKMEYKDNNKQITRTISSW